MLERGQWNLAFFSLSSSLLGPPPSSQLDWVLNQVIFGGGAGGSSGMLYSMTERALWMLTYMKEILSDNFRVLPKLMLLGLLFLISLSLLISYFSMSKGN